jgi:hypothetical protein
LKIRDLYEAGRTPDEEGHSHI